MNSLSFLEKFNGQRILVAVLNWGLGHATRSAPIIQKLQKHNEVILGSDGLSLQWLKKEFPNARYVELPSYNIEYRDGPFLLNMLRQSPKITLAISKELAQTEEIVKQYRINSIISDHRLGCRDDACQNYIIVHQLQIMGSVPISWVAKRLNKYFINAFDQCWIPDYANPMLSLAGDLSRPEGIKKYRYIGPLSRLKYRNVSPVIDVLVILSGPEPARTKLEEKLAPMLSGLPFKSMMIRGTTQVCQNNLSNISFVNLAGTAQLNDLMNKAKIVISRTGYSTLMDLVNLKKKAILIPTPGQTEQVYLAQYGERFENFKMLEEKDLTIDLLERQIDQLLN